MKSTSPDRLLRGMGLPAPSSAKAAAIFDTQGKVLRTFAQIEEEARDLERKLLRGFRAGEVIAIQIGNHAAWPALLLACLRRRLVALPLERTMAERERDAALRICRAAAIVETRRQARPSTNESRFDRCRTSQSIGDRIRRRS